MVIVASPQKATLLDFRYRRNYEAEDGGKGGGKQRHGKAGAELEIPVPPGTLVKTPDGEIVADLDRPGKRVRVARGGRGGLGNLHFATATNRTPRIAQKGEPGQELWLELELQLIADVGIIGYPNAGKSTFLAATTRATPKIADYPFTTLTPNLGVALVGDRELTLADIPGLIEGAHAGIGLGHEFLRHISRTKVLLHLIDGALPDLIAAYNAVNAELRLFDEKLAEKPQLVVVNKLDITEVRERQPEIRATFHKLGIVPWFASAATGEGVREIIDETIRRLDEVARAETVESPSSNELVILRPVGRAEGFTVVREANGIRVSGARVERLVAMTDFELEEGAAELQRQLKKLGVTGALEKAGVREGDLVRFGKIELEWTS